MTNDEKIRYIAEHYGILAQIGQLYEEIGELMQAINRMRRSVGFGQSITAEPAECVDNVYEELADVEIMIGQVKYLLNGNEAVDRIIREKLDRQIKRIEEEGTCRS